jgi:hypothetical protein
MMRPISQRDRDKLSADIAVLESGFPMPGMLPVSIPAILAMPMSPIVRSGGESIGGIGALMLGYDLRGRDNYSDQPTPLGGGGARIACGGNRVGAEIQ